jgi:restriction system protein
MARKKENKNIPSYDEMMIPVIQALISLGGSGTINEINEKVYDILNFEDSILEIPHTENDTRSELEYRLAWTRTYLKKFGLLDNSERGIWALTKSDINIDTISPAEIVKTVKDKDRQEREQEVVEPEIDEVEENTEDWKSKLINVILNLSPQAFERLTQRLLRESGFVQVEVTGRSGDGGIDGKGIVKLSGLLSFHIIFQCKRYKGSVTPSHIRDFRGAMQGRADKGLFITTGTFTREAAKEATRDGAPPIDLIDGEILCDKLKELKLGITTQKIESVDIQEDWYKNL